MLSQVQRLKMEHVAMVLLSALYMIRKGGESHTNLIVIS